jgi:hypothetical protein
MAEKYSPILGGFVPLAALWDAERGVSDAPLFPSECAARWYVQVNRAALINARAIAWHRRRIFIHPERFNVAAAELAVTAYACRHAGGEAGVPSHG